MQTHLPAVLKALRFHDRSTDDLERIPENAWPALLDATDRGQLTLALGLRCSASVPAFVRARIDRSLAGNNARYERLLAAHCEMCKSLAGNNIEYVLMKGLSQWPWYSDDPRHRPQYDIDIYIPPESLLAAANAMRQYGYEFVTDALDPGADHLPVMIRQTGWTWRGDYYDPEMPPSLELHYRFWNRQRLRIDAGDLAPFWLRRRVREVGGMRFACLDPVDGLSYSALHLIRHLLNGDLRPRHVYEIAHFLERSAGDDEFWSRRRETGLRSCHVMEGIAFRLASEWFHCKLNPAAQEAIEQLPASVNRWFALFASSPESVIDNPDKSELWLHFCLVNTRRDRLAIMVRRLFPTSRSRVVLDAHVRATNVSPGLRIKRAVFEASFLVKRALHHLRTLAPAIRGAYMWWSYE